jgi:5-methylcytosine-specific restriction enzyme A
MATLRGTPVAWAEFYDTSRRQRLRKLQLKAEPPCKFCLEGGIVTAATVVDHVVPHHGDWNAFVTGGLQSLYEPCHKSAKSELELHGYRNDIGLDGYPTEPNHPFNRVR